MSDGPLSPPPSSPAPPPLRLPARLFLLAWKPDAEGEAEGRAELCGRLVRAGALVEAARLGLLTDADSVATPSGTGGFTGDPVLDGLLELVEESMPRTWGAWVSVHTGVTLDVVREQLADAGRLKKERRRVLKVFPAVEYAPADRATADELRDGALEILRGGTAVEEVAVTDAALVVLAAAAGSDVLVADGERARHAARLDALTLRAAAPAAVLRKVLSETAAAISEEP